MLLGFRHDDAQYYVVRLLDPVFVVGKQVATSRFEIPSEREVERVAPALEEVMARKDQATTHAFAAACFGAAFVMLFVKLNVLLLVAAFVALRHPIVWKPATLPYRLALAAEER